MFSGWRRSVAALGVTAVVGFVGLVPAQIQESQDQTGDAGLFTYGGGPARGKRAKTQTAAFTFGETAGWVTLPSSSLSWTVPAGTTDLFNVAFSAECRLINGGGDDYLRIRILDIVGGVATPLEPYDGAQAFCSADGYATHKATG